MKKIIVDIENGIPTITVQGVKGASCIKETEELEQALGDTRKIRNTLEMFEKETNANRVKH